MKKKKLWKSYTLALNDLGLKIIMQHLNIRKITKMRLILSISTFNNTLEELGNPKTFFNLVHANTY